MGVIYMDMMLVVLRTFIEGFTLASQRGDFAVLFVENHGQSALSMIT